VVPDPLSTRSRRTPGLARHARQKSCARCCGAGPASPSTMRRRRRWHGVREALRGDLGKPLCGHLTGQRWTGCAPESLRCWIIR
jgi:hypothetical protein